MRILRWALAVVVGIPLLVAVVVAADIALYASQSDPLPADAAIVLGAAVADDEPTPVFEERLRHAVVLYRSGQVKRLVMTGGLGPGDVLAESEAARAYAIANGVPPDAILVETASRTTKENLVNVLPLLSTHDLGRVLVVSDPLHMRRALRMATDLGLDAYPSPTPTSRFQSLGTQVPMLLRETWFTFTYLLNRQ
jgi:uncharacterized SAM-binding protein YcdF (DUF218 family)